MRRSFWCAWIAAAAVTALLTSPAEATAGKPVPPVPRSKVADPEVRTTAAPKPDLRVLVMGDSYSAGNGAGDYYGPKGCYRSRKNYAEVFAATLRAKPYSQPAKVANVACSGAVTQDFWHAKDGRPRQLDAVNRNLDLVLLTVGGNDVHFSDIVRNCLVGASRAGKKCDGSLDRAEKLVSDGTMRRRIRDVLKGIRGRTNSGAKVVLLGYPYLEGDAGYTLRIGRGSKAPVVKVGKRVRALGDQADTIGRSLVGELNRDAPGDPFLFVSTQKLFNGPPFHGLYANKNNPRRWMVQPVLDAPLLPCSTCYHPNTTGWEQEGRLLARTSGVPRSRTNPVITSVHLPDGTAGRPYSFRLTTADNRQGTWSIASGKLPNGLSLSGPTISGTPTTRSHMSLQVRFVDVHNTATTASTSLLVNAAPTPGAWTAARNPLPVDRSGKSGAVPTVACGGGMCASVSSHPDAAGRTQYALSHLQNGVWHVTRPPVPSGVKPPQYNAGVVGCTADGDCVGTAAYPPSDSGDSVQVFWTLTNGAWTTVRAPLPPNAGSLRSGPHRLSCGKNVCGGFGWYAPKGDPGAWAPALWTWTRATGWRAAEGKIPAGVTGSPGTGAALLACGDNVCAATDSYGDDQLLWSWTPNGGWVAHRPTAPAGTTLQNGYTPVACATGVCAALGTYQRPDGGGGTATGTVIWTWRPGVGWNAGTLTPVPADAQYPGYALRVSCGGARCVAAGYYYAADTAYRSLVWNWTAQSGWMWTAPTPGDGGTKPDYDQVSCGTNICAITGDYTADGKTVNALWTSKDGSGWTLDADPASPARNPQPPYVNYFRSVSCGTGQCASTVSFWDGQAKVTRSLLLHYDPQRGWAPTDPAALPADAGTDPAQYLYEVTCGTTACVAAGSYYTDLPAEIYQGVLWTRHPS